MRCPSPTSSRLICFSVRFTATRFVFSSKNSLLRETRDVLFSSLFLLLIRQSHAVAVAAESIYVITPRHHERKRERGAERSQIFDRGSTIFIRLDIHLRAQKTSERGVVTFVVFVVTFVVVIIRDGDYFQV